MDKETNKQIIKAAKNEAASRNIAGNVFSGVLAAWIVFLLMDLFGLSGTLIKLISG